MQLQTYVAQIQQPELLHLADLLLSNLPGCKLQSPDGLSATDRMERQLQARTNTSFPCSLQCLVAVATFLPDTQQVLPSMATECMPAVCEGIMLCGREDGLHQRLRLCWLAHLDHGRHGRSPQLHYSQ